MCGLVKCLVCGTYLQSKSRHDFQCCKCENGTFVDGGFAYSRVGGKDLDKIETIQHYHQRFAVEGLEVEGKELHFDWHLDFAV